MSFPEFAQRVVLVKAPPSTPPPPPTPPPQTHTHHHHYEKMPIQICKKFHHQKYENFQIKKSDIFSYFCSETEIVGTR